MKILLAEDEESIARALKLMLEKNKYTVDLVFNGADALEHIVSSEYDALVLDIMMPGMDGIEVLTAARSRGVTAPALFLTPKARSRTASPGSTPGRTTTCPSPSPPASFWPGYAPSCGAAGPMRPPSSALAAWSSTAAATPCAQTAESCA